METLRFSYNWNNKLTNKAFTSLRLHSPAKHQRGQRYRIECKGQMYGVAVLHEVRTVKVSALNDFVTYLDTGYNRAETLKMLQTMYKNKCIDWNTQLLDFCLLVYEKEGAKGSNGFENK
jgi:hypothetical protein